MSRWTFACVILLLQAPAAVSLTRQGGAAVSKSLPMPEGLEADVHFWEKVFSKYSPEQCVFHDKDNLDVIYVVKKIPGFTAAAQSRNIRRYLGAIRASLKYLGDGGTPRNLLERRIVAVTPPEARTPTDFRVAMDNVRCQRGVDLEPSFERARRHVAMVRRVLVQLGLPGDLAHLPHLESGYHLGAYSRAGARGLWQLMPATARLQGLRVSRSVDQRLSAYKSTIAAAGLLKELYQMTRSWPLAITAYNYGPNGMARAIQQWGDDYMTIREKHRTRIFGFAARNYYPSFLAVRNLAESEEGAADSDDDESHL